MKDIKGLLKSNVKIKRKINNCEMNSSNKISKSNCELVRILIISILSLIIIESISRASIIKAMSFIFGNPLLAIINLSLLLILFGISSAFKRKGFVQGLIAIILIGLSSVNAEVLKDRGIPLSPYDIYSIKEALGVSKVFLSTKIIILIVVILIVLAFILVILFIKDRETKRIASLRNVIAIVVLASVFFLVVPQLSKANIIKYYAWDPPLTYETNGFTYSFYYETIRSFRKKPEGYSEKSLKDLRAMLDKKDSEYAKKISETKVKPNIIVVQLESFMDPTRIEGIEFNQDPMPNMRRLMKNYTSGYIKVPTLGGGTARTEFSVLSGSSFDYLINGEIPYQTFLSQKTSPSIASNLLLNGYKTVAIHNFKREFYNRNKALPNLGFQKFISIENMKGYSSTYMGWPKDDILTKYITQEIDAENKRPSFIFTVSTQGHSRYPMDNLDNIYFNINIEKSSLPKADSNQIRYYANQVYEMDAFVGDLVKKINDLKQPTLLVMYGDHLPALNIITNDKTKLDKYASMFTIVNNFGVAKTEIPKDFECYQLSTLMLEMANQKMGPMNLVHKYLSKDKDYQKYLSLVQYDILFGKKYFLKEDEIQTKYKLNN